MVLGRVSIIHIIFLIWLLLVVVVAAEKVIFLAQAVVEALVD
jgi:hypothetical protein